MSITKAIVEWENVDKAIFENDIVPRYQPAVLRGFVKDWPAVAAGMESPTILANYLRSFDQGRTVETFVGEPDIKGRFFYSSDMKQFNFKRVKDPFAIALDRLMNYLDHPNPPALYTGSAPIPACIPEFSITNQNPIIDASIPPNLWMGNKTTIGAHYDLSDNIACVVAGQRRFTLFPAEQVTNLYVGPIDNTVAGQPISMVNLAEPDLEKYPRFSEALAVAQSAILEPGDAIYIPSMWWHSVESLSAFNVLVNYWWMHSPIEASTPFECLVHALLTIRSLPPERRNAWKAMFNYYIFEADENTLSHLPPQHRGALRDMTPQVETYLQKFLLQSLHENLK